MGVLSPVLSTQEPVAGPRFNPFRGPYRGHGYFYSQPDPPTSLSLYRAHRQLLSRAFDISHLALFVSLRFAFGPLWFLGFIVFVFGFFSPFFWLRLSALAAILALLFMAMSSGRRLVKRVPRPPRPLPQRFGLHLTCGCCVRASFIFIFIFLFILFFYTYIFPFFPVAIV